jgi:hypothetical protein
LILIISPYHVTQGSANRGSKVKAKAEVKVKQKMAGKLTGFQAGQHSSFGSCVPFENLGEYAARRVKHFPMFEHRC